MRKFTLIFMMVIAVIALAGDIVWIVDLVRKGERFFFHLLGALFLVMVLVSLHDNYNRVRENERNQD